MGLDKKYSSISSDKKYSSIAYNNLSKLHFYKNEGHV